ncbi:hypothetical protein [Rhizobium yanglingense]
MVKEGQKVWVKLMGFDERGKVRLSMKVVDQETGKEIVQEKKSAKKTQNKLLNISRSKRARIPFSGALFLDYTVQKTDIIMSQRRAQDAFPALCPGDTANSRYRREMAVPWC